MPTPQEAAYYLDVLGQIASTPTASFHEHRVLNKIRAFLDELTIPYQTDRWGNVIAHYQKGEGIPPLAYMAHTDHPAFELVAAGAPPEFPQANWTGKLLGGVSPACFDKEVSVRLYSADQTQQPLYGKLVGYKIGEKGPRDVNLFFQFKGEIPSLKGNFGVWDITDFELKDGFVHARAIDDLVGCAATLLAFWKLVQAGAEANLYGIFTRAEEVGLVGADMVFQSGVLPKETWVVSLEASKALPGAAQGAGPVIRAGDRAFTFNEQAEFILKRAAASLGGDVGGRSPQQTPIQRQLMTGGRCEAGSAILNGYLATGLAFPLGNYHNVSDDFTLEPENITQQDFLTGVELLQQAALMMAWLPDLQAEFLAKESVDHALADRLEATTEI